MLLRRTALCLPLMLTAAKFLEAHAILLESKPSPKQPATGPDVEVSLRFNSRIDGKRSKLTVIGPAQQHAEIPIDQPTPDRLNSKATGLAPGSYRLRWQVLATDGHITQGEVPFQVK
jgi:methionine-rich copper-binding protein CopC